MIFSPLKYVRFCLAGTFSVLGFVLLFNYVMDPYGIYHYGQPWDWITSRPILLVNMYIHKAHDVLHAKADVLLMGNSRVLNGLDPHETDLPPNTYNLGLPASGPYENWRYLQHAASVHLPKMIIFGIDSDSFSSAHVPFGDFQEDLLRVDASGNPNPAAPYADLGSTLLSFSALEASYKTLIADTRSPIQFKQGYQGRSAAEGSELAKDVLAFNERLKLKPAPSYIGKDGRMPQMDAFQDIATFCAHNHIRLIVFVHPLHSSLLDQYTQDWAGYSGWLKSVARIMDSTPGLNGELWDFAGYNTISTEPFPLATDRYSHMKYYHEFGHYRSRVGDMVLRKMLTDVGPKAFGQRVTSANVDEDLQRLRNEKEAWHLHGQGVFIETNSPVTPSK